MRSYLAWCGAGAGVAIQRRAAAAAASQTDAELNVCAAPSCASNDASPDTGAVNHMCIFTKQQHQQQQ